MDANLFMPMIDPEDRFLKRIMAVITTNLDDPNALDRSMRQFALGIIEEIANGRGTFIHKKPPATPEEAWDSSECPFCGEYSYIAFIDNEWDGNQSSPDDVFECFGCGATSTRRDAFGHYEPGYWDKDQWLNDGSDVGGPPDAEESWEEVGRAGDPFDD